MEPGSDHHLSTFIQNAVTKPSPNPSSSTTLSVGSSTRRESRFICPPPWPRRANFKRSHGARRSASESRTTRGASVTPSITPAPAI